MGQETMQSEVKCIHQDYGIYEEGAQAAVSSYPVYEYFPPTTRWGHVIDCLQLAANPSH